MTRRTVEVQFLPISKKFICTDDQGINQTFTDKKLLTWLTSHVKQGTLMYMQVKLAYPERSNEPSKADKDRRP